MGGVGSKGKDGVEFNQRRKENTTRRRGKVKEMVGRSFGREGGGPLPLFTAEKEGTPT